MFAILQTLLLCVHLLHFKTTLVLGAAAVAAPSSAAQLNLTASIEPATQQRSQRQLFYDPSLFLLQGGLGGGGLGVGGFGGGGLGGLGGLGAGAFSSLAGFGGWEGAKCLTTRGQPGVCVRIHNCQQYYRVARQVTLIALRQWPPSAGLGLGADLCNFFDQLGRVNNGICCTALDASAFGVFPMPTTTTTTTTERPAPAADELDKVEEADAEHEPEPEPEPEPELDLEQEEVGEEQTVAELEQPAQNPDAVSSVEETPDFQDVNTIEANTPEPALLPVPMPAPAPVPAQPGTTVYPYQWPFGTFAGGVAQWPPPLPTHPPSSGGWPPPIPTHPPNHHYPTHPSTGGGTRPTPPTPPSQALSTRRTTTRPTSTRPTTTTRRPSYAPFPGYPVTPLSTTTTTRRPTTIAGGSTAEGLPLQCGSKNPVSPDQERIVGGINASPHEFPWIAVLFKSGKQFCGGSLITNSHVLTAAHCVARMTSWDVAALTVHLGDYNIRTDFEVQHVQRRIKRLVRHKGFEFSTLHNDIAILTLDAPVPFTREIQPICLPTSAVQQSRSYTGQVATVAGWGSLRENGPQPSILQKVDIPIWANAECARKYGRAAPAGIIESMICAGQAAKDSCSGDSGGPMIINESGRYTQVGIVSWGIGCGKGQYPGVYTRVTSLLPWIYKNIK